MPRRIPSGVLAALASLAIVVACGTGDDEISTNMPPPQGQRDGGDSAARDAGVVDRDGGVVDGGDRDGGDRDAGARDAGDPDGGDPDSGVRDAGEGVDAGPPRDAGVRDAGFVRDGGPAPRDGGPAPRDGGPPRDGGFVRDGGPGCNPAPTMTFFFTEQGSGAAGGNLGGLAGADAICQAAATAAGAGGRTWRAYLSAMADATYGRVDARDRIGAGPWFNYDGVSIGAHAAIHHENGGTGIPANLQKSECGFEIVQGPFPLFDIAHDILTGSDAQGRLVGGSDPVNDPPLTCEDWTSNATFRICRVGHEDTDFSSGTWNDAHDTVGCDQASFESTLSIGRIYCFAIN